MCRPRPDGRHIVVDFAASAVALGTARAAWLRRERLADGMLVDAEGQPTTVIDPDAFGGRDGFEREATILVDALRQTPPAKGVAMVQLPGDPERAATAERRQGGLEVDDHTWASLVKAAAVLGLDAAAIVTRRDGAS